MKAEATFPGVFIKTLDFKGYPLYDDVWYFHYPHDMPRKVICV